MYWSRDKKDEEKRKNLQGIEPGFDSLFLYFIRRPYQVIKTLMTSLWFVWFSSKNKRFQVRRGEKRMPLTVLPRDDRWQIPNSLPFIFHSWKQLELTETGENATRLKRQIQHCQLGLSINKKAVSSSFSIPFSLMVSLCRLTSPYSFYSFFESSLRWRTPKQRKD